MTATLRMADVISQLDHYRCPLAGLCLHLSPCRSRVHKDASVNLKMGLGHTTLLHTPLGVLWLHLGKKRINSLNVLHFSWVSLTSPVLFCILLSLETMINLGGKKPNKQKNVRIWLVTFDLGLNSSLLSWKWCFSLNFTWMGHMEPSLLFLKNVKIISWRTGYI